ncbi:uncharacterized protein BXZ73DRAFT_102797 [Epithele typhae]|uniref:uncharacterized protein n=1 Tax=Epithele typhae TaxID=378194 RepID=UPI0020075309|nr:uncharacterized protein BXZ73DRAFT_102797 [Epithele typhae]KAH9927211.1 hypothetical protein BXZ73DRAFT_102797 [Epithele typhae]
MDPLEFTLSAQERVQLAISKLPVLTKQDIPTGDSCPICLNPLDALIEDRDQGKLTTTPGEEASEVGVTKLVGCGHIFCRACLVEWIKGRHGSCPSCRAVFSSLKPASDSDNESSDGDYVPGDDEDDEDEDDGFLDSDGLMETESVIDTMDVEDDLDEDDIEMDGDEAMRIWEERAANAIMENWGLSSDGEGSEDASEVEALALSEELSGPPQADDAAVYSDAGESSGVLETPSEAVRESKV